MRIRSRFARRLRGPAVFVLLLLAIEFLDEFAYGAQEAALPLIRTDLGLGYDQVGLLLALPPLLANLFFEPVLGILGDVWKRRLLVMGGAVGFALAAWLISGSQSYAALLAAMILLHPSSGAFVGLSQSTLMDLEPERHEQNMARWTFSGSLGVVGGALLVGLFVAAGLGWRAFYLLVGVLAVGALLVLWRLPFPANSHPAESPLPFWAGLRAGFREAGRALRRREVVRWMLLLEFSDFMLDILHGYLALYFVDVVGVPEAQAGLAVAIWTGVGLVGDFALIPLLNRVRGVTYLRFSAALEFGLYTAFLIVPGLIPKLVLIGVIGFFNAGWYAILSGNLYTALPGQSGTAMTIGNLFGLIGSVVPLLIGLAAERFGLEAAMLFPLVGCVALWIGLPRQVDVSREADEQEVSSG
ncbi:MAG: MFS transporter [Anaerolineae bacterium]|nr:MFS transporter [Anaerolineae bacterium]